SDTTGTLLVLDTKTSSGDPSGVDGAMYYNASYGGFRCYSDGAWRFCNEARSLSWGINIQEEFLGFDLWESDAFGIGQHGWHMVNSGSGSGAGVADTDSYQRPGVLEFETGTSSSGYAGISLSGGSGTSMESFAIGGGEIIEFAINLPTL